MNNFYKIGHSSLFMMLRNGFWYTYTIMQMVREWMYGADRRTSEFMDGLREFLRVADANKRNGFVFCPCSECKNTKDYSDSKILHSHLFRYGFVPSYNCWTKHGERWVIMEENEEE